MTLIGFRDVISFEVGLVRKRAELRIGPERYIRDLSLPPLHRITEGVINVKHVIDPHSPFELTVPIYMGDVAHCVTRGHTQARKSLQSALSSGQGCPKL